MKHKLLLFPIVLILLTEELHSQNDPKIMLSFLSSVQWGEGNNPYPLKVQNGNNWSYNTFEFPIIASYVKADLLLKYYSNLNYHNWYFITEYGAGMDNYESTLYYGNYDKNAIWSQNSYTEKISGGYFHVNIGFGKMLYLNSNKRLSLFTELMCGMESFLYSKEVKGQYYYNSTNNYFGVTTFEWTKNLSPLSLNLQNDKRKKTVQPRI